MQRIRVRGHRLDPPRLQSLHLAIAYFFLPDLVQYHDCFTWYLCTRIRLRTMLSRNDERERNSLGHKKHNYGKKDAFGEVQCLKWI